MASVDYTIANLRRAIQQLAARADTQAQRLTVLERNTVQRVAVQLDNLAVGATDVPIVWPQPMPAPNYTPLCSVQGGDNAINVLRCGLKPGTKDENGCVIRVINTGAVVIVTVALDVVAVRG
jgi:hypothetical protein